MRKKEITLRKVKRRRKWKESGGRSGGKGVNRRKEKGERKGWS